MKKHRPKLNTQILEEAASWFIDLDESDLDLATRQDFNTWLRLSPEHVRAFLQVTGFWEDVRIPDKPGNLDIDNLIDRAKAEHNVHPLESFLSPREKTAARDENLSCAAESKRFGFPQAIAAAVLLTLGASLTTWITLHGDPTYTTEIGEQRSIPLQDGSFVELNSRSRVNVHFTEHERTVELLEGQALFRVAKSTARPFIVHSGLTTVRAVGTQFDVYRKNTGTIITVVEGQVAVNPSAAYRSQVIELAARHDSYSLSSLRERRVEDSEAFSARKAAKEPNGAALPPSSAAANALTASTEREGIREAGGVSDSRGADQTAAPGEILLIAGQQLAVGSTALPEPEPANITVATAWTEKKLIFESTALRDVVQEFNRYNRQQLVIRDVDLNDYHVSGTFPSTDPSRMIEFLRRRFGISMNREGDEIELARSVPSARNTER